MKIISIVFSRLAAVKFCGVIILALIAFLSRVSSGGLIQLPKIEFAATVINAFPGHDVHVGVRRIPGSRKDAVAVDYETVEGTAKAGHFTSVRGRLHFAPESDYERIFIPRGALPGASGKSFKVILKSDSVGIVDPERSTATVEFLHKVEFSSARYIIDSEGRLKGKLIFADAPLTNMEVNLIFPGGFRSFEAKAGVREVPFDILLPAVQPMSITAQSKAIFGESAQVLPHRFADLNFPDFSVEMYEIDSGANGIRLEMQASGNLPVEAVEVVIRTSGALAQGVDYVLSTNRLSLSRDQPSAAFEINSLIERLSPFPGPHIRLEVVPAAQPTQLLGSLAVQLPSGSYADSVAEADPPGKAKVALWRQTPREYRFFTRNGTAVAGEDYIHAEGRVFVPGNGISTNIWITILNDHLIEPTEYFEVVLAPVDAPTQMDIVQVRIPDDELPVRNSRVIAHGGHLAWRMRADGALMFLSDEGRLHRLDDKGLAIEVAQIKTSSRIAPSVWTPLADGGLIFAEADHHGEAKRLRRADSKGNLAPDVLFELSYGKPTALTIDAQNRLLIAWKHLDGSAHIERLSSNGETDGSFRRFFIPYGAISELYLVGGRLWVEHATDSWHHKVRNYFWVDDGIRVNVAGASTPLFPFVDGSLMWSDHGVTFRTAPDGALVPNSVNATMPHRIIGARENGALVAAVSDAEISEIFSTVDPLLVQLEVQEASGTESSPGLQLQILRRGNTTHETRARLVTSDKTAKAGEDYVALETNVVFMPGVSRLPVTVQVLDDRRYEGREQFGVALFDQTDSLVHSVSAAIYDDEPRIFFELSMGQLAEPRLNFQNPSAKGAIVQSAPTPLGPWANVRAVAAHGSWSGALDLRGPAQFFRAIEAH